MRACNCARASPFQSRTRVGCDMILKSAIMSRLTFQSTHPRGVRRTPIAGRKDIKEFQSTHPRGVRLRPLTVFRSRRACFNPRTRVGCDTASMSVLSTVRLFQSTHPRGVRRSAVRRRTTTAPVSIHAPAWGATIARLPVFYNMLGFNPRTRVGGDAPPDD